MFALINAFLAYFMWGLFPLFWNQIQTIHSYDLIALRIIISLLTLFPAMYFRKTILDYFKNLKSKKVMALMFMSGLFVTINWSVYIYAITNGKIVESSLGYFITPLINILFGVIFLKEKLSKYKIIAFILASMGIATMIWKTGSIPIISLIIALSFAAYALSRKRIPIPPLVGLALEITWFIIPSLFYLNFFNQSVYHQIPNLEWFYLALSGLATIIPLICFNHAVKGLPLSTVGLIQYVSPTLQFMTGIFIYNEPFSEEKLLAFSFIWAGLVIMGAGSLLDQYKIRRCAILQPK